MGRFHPRPASIDRALANTYNRTQVLRSDGMQCAAGVGSGQRCDREAEPDSPLCSHHLRRCQELSYYSRRPTPEEMQWIGVAAQMEGVHAEIPVVRLLIRRALSAGDEAMALRGVDLLCRALETDRRLRSASKSPLPLGEGKGERVQRAKMLTADC